SIREARHDVDACLSSQRLAPQQTVGRPRRNLKHCPCGVANCKGRHLLCARTTVKLGYRCGKLAPSSWVGVNNPPVCIEEEDGIGDGVEDRLHALRLLGNPTFQPPSLGNVASDLRGADDRAYTVANRRDRQRDFERSTILRYPYGLKMLDALTLPDAREN